MQTDQLSLLDKWIERYLKEKQTLNLSKNTIVNYKRVLESFYDFYALQEEKNGIVSLQDINREFILEYLDTKGEISTNTKNLHITVIKAFLNYIADHSDKELNFSKQLKGLVAKSIKSESESLSEYESRLLEEYLLNERYKKSFLSVRNRLLLKLLYYTGMRASELLQIRFEDIALLEMEDVYKIHILGKGSKYRYVYIPRERICDELNFLETFFSQDEQQRSSNPNRYIAVSKKGRVLHRVELYNMLQKLYKRVGIQKRGVHILRHTFGKRMVKKGVNLSTIKELMGHENIQTTMIYARSDEKGMIAAVCNTIGH